MVNVKVIELVCTVYLACMCASCAQSQSDLQTKSDSHLLEPVFSTYYVQSDNGVYEVAVSETEFRDLKKVGGCEAVDRTGNTCIVSQHTFDSLAANSSP